MKQTAAQRRIDNASIDFARHVLNTWATEENKKKDRRQNLQAGALVALVLWFALLVYLAA